jgi:putative oxidoreductase
VVPYARQAKVPLSGVMVPLTGLMLLAGGIGVAFGIWGDLAAALIAAFLIPTAFFMHRFWGATSRRR